MNRLRSNAGVGFISLVFSLLIIAFLITFYIREFAPVGPKGGTAGGALEATKLRAQQFEAQQNQRLEQMDEAAH